MASPAEIVLEAYTAIGLAWSELLASVVQLSNALLDHGDVPKAKSLATALESIGEVTLSSEMMHAIESKERIKIQSAIEASLQLALPRALPSPEEVSAALGSLRVVLDTAPAALPRISDVLIRVLEGSIAEFQYWQ